MLRTIGAHKIICSGVTVGTMDIISDYITLMAQIIFGNPLSPELKKQLGGKSAFPSNNRKGSNFPQCERNGVDQGVHNVLIHNGYFSSMYERHENNYKGHDGDNIVVEWSQSGPTEGQSRSTPVCNMQAKLCSIINAEAGSSNEIGYEVYNTNHEKVLVVHQYDRFPELQKALFAKYVDWTNTQDPNAEWKQEPACEVFKPYQDMDMFKGTCDLEGKGGATAATSCCRWCKENPECKGFTYYNGQCFLKNCYETRKQAPLPGALSGIMIR